MDEKQVCVAWVAQPGTTELRKTGKHCDCAECVNQNRVLDEMAEAAGYEVADEMDE